MVGQGARRSLGEHRLKSTAMAAIRSSQQRLTVPVTGTQAEEHRVVKAKIDLGLELTWFVIVDVGVVVWGFCRDGE